MEAVAIVLIPFLGTSLGAAMVFSLKGEMNFRLEKFLLGFASGVMIAASVWSLLIPSIEMAGEQGKHAWLPAAAGFLLGMAFLLFLDHMVPPVPVESGKNEGADSDLQKISMMVMAVTLHNLPEGMAVGVVLAGALTENAGVTLAGAMVLSLGISIQNFPEGAIISMPLRNAGLSRLRAFWYGALSGMVEPLGAGVTLLLAEQVVPVLPYLLSFAAGAMMYVVVNELIPGSEKDTDMGTMGMAAGFVLMMVLDVAV